MKKSKRVAVSRKRPDPLEVRPAEQMLIDAVPDLPEGRLLCTSVGRGQFAVAAAQGHPASSVRCSVLDLYTLQQADKLQAPLPPNLTFECAADFPDDEVDVFALPIMTSGDGELVREYLQAGHRRLRIGGTIVAATDNASDSWLHDELRKHFAKVTRQTGESRHVVHRDEAGAAPQDEELRMPFRLSRRGPSDPAPSAGRSLQSPTGGRRCPRPDAHGDRLRPGTACSNWAAARESSRSRWPCGHRVLRFWRSTPAPAPSSAHVSEPKTTAWRTSPPELSTAESTSEAEIDFRRLRPGRGESAVFLELSDCRDLRPLRLQGP